MNRQIFWWVILALLVIGNAWAWRSYWGARAELKAAQAEVGRTQFNSRVINFTSLFVDRVLQADREVDFETRLLLENSVRELKDEQILNQWRRFVDSGTEAEAQTEVKKLLAVLVAKISDQAVRGGTNGAGN